jgi:bacteriocin biosynthesis cyclodehydratase domain-containing protein
MREEVADAGTRALRRSDAQAGFDHQGQLTRCSASGVADSASAAPLVGAQRPRLKTSIDVFTASDGTLYLIHPSGEDLMIETPPPGAALLLQSLDGTRTRDDLVSELGDRDDVDVDSALAQLWTLDLIEDASRDGRFGLSTAELLRYDRQLAYFAELAPAGVHGQALQSRLGTAQVAIIGLGGLGCWTASALACSGVGRIVIVDGDVVKPSNLNRQMLFTPDAIGASKAEVGARALRAFNPHIDIVPVTRRLDSEQAIFEVAEGSDVIAELADWPVDKISRWTAGAAHRLGVPYVQSSQDPPLVRVGPTFVPGVTGCAECQALEHRRRHELYDELVAFRAERVEENPTFGPACAIIGGVVANEIVNLLLGIAPPATVGRAATVDLRTLEWVWGDPVTPDPDCPVCDGGAQNDCDLAASAGGDARKQLHTQ